MSIAQITDMHIRPEGVLAYGRLDTAPYLARAVEHLLALRPRPDLVLATGDLVDGGSPEEYRRLREFAGAAAMPVYLIPGNHDDATRSPSRVSPITRTCPGADGSCNTPSRSIR